MTYKNISEIELFPRYATREAFAAAHGGKEPQAFDPARPPKYWYDPEAANKAAGVRRLVKYNVLAMTPTGGFVPTAEGFVVMEEIPLTVNEASSVNIPPSQPFPGSATEYSALEVPIPVRLLKADERVVLRQPMNSLALAIIDPAAPPAPPEPSGSMLSQLLAEQERQGDLLNRIADRLQIPR